MNILLAGATDVPPPYGGLARRILFNCRFWEERHAVTLLLRWRKPDEDYMELRRTRIEHVYHFPPEQGGRRAILLRHRLLPALGVLARRPALAGLVTRQRGLLFTGKRGVRRFTALADHLNYAAALEDLLVDAGTEVIMSYYARQESLVTEVVAARRGIPVVVTSFAESVVWPEEGEEISDEALYDAMPTWDPLFRATYGRAARVVSAGIHCMDGPLRFVPPEKAVLGYAGIDIEAVEAYRQRRDQYRAELGLDGEQVILYVGQITPRKGPQYLAQAMPLILARVPRAFAVFIGSDLGYRNELEAAVAPFRARVRFTGGVDNDTLMKYYAAGDVLAFPTATERECQGMSMSEAMAAGTPAVTFRAGGAPEVVEEGVSGYVVDVGDVPALADRLARVLEGRDTIDRAACVRRARELFDARATAANEEAVLARALRDARATRR